MVEFSFIVLSPFDVVTASIEVLLFSSFPIESLESSVRRPLADVLFHVEVCSEDFPSIKRIVTIQISRRLDNLLQLQLNPLLKYYPKFICIPETLCTDGCTAKDTTCIVDLSLVEVGGG